MLQGSFIWGSIGRSMTANSAYISHGVRPNWPPIRPSPVSRRRIELQCHQPRHLGFLLSKGKTLHKSISSFHSICAINGQGRETETTTNPAIFSPLQSPWEDYPYEELPNGKRLYLDELDVITFLNPPKQLIPLDISSFNSASYLWKKIDDIPFERRHRLLNLIAPSLISIAWEIAGTRYEDPKLAKTIAPDLLSNRDDESDWLEYWNCRKSGGPMPISGINVFKKVLFRSSDDGITYGRLIGTSIVGSFASSMYPLYFTVSEVREVMSTGQPCDFAYQFGDGLWNLLGCPQGFPTPAKHPWPFNDQVVIYMRYLGPGVMVGQAWQEGESIEQVPKKLCEEILMVKEFPAAENQMN